MPYMFSGSAWPTSVPAPHARNSMYGYERAYWYVRQAETIVTPRKGRRETDARQLLHEF